MWERRCYKMGIPDEVDKILEISNKVPTYRMICRAIMMNDIALTTLGFTRKDCNYYGVLKRIELSERNKNQDKQMEFFNEFI
jgi:predicted phosphoadenosine phosphosulfate sulfurtransferase